jgi:sigma-B regulation protein RsbU (phosphoserine phosphatase)
MELQSMIWSEREAMAPVTSDFTASSRRPRVLVSEDHEDVLVAIGLLLKNSGFEGEFVSSPADALNALASRKFDAVLLDLNYSRDTTSGVEGLDLLTAVQKIDSTLPIIVMTAWGTIELAVEAMHRGASDFVQKPWDNRHLLEVLERQMDRARKLRESRWHEEFEQQEAAQIQRALLPARLDAPDGLTIAAATRSLRNVSGDYYDVIRLDEHRSAICIADVMGKGMAAALLMSNLQAAVRMLAPQIADPSELCRRLNETISSNGVPGKFITFFYCIVDTETMQITYSNAGHNWPMLARANGDCERLRTDDVVLGTLWKWNYRQKQIELRAGDRLVLFTDGITESTDDLGNEFGEEQLRQLIIENVQLPAETLEQLILNSAQAYSNGALSDDTTLIVAAVK